jgi:hypothetical protein
MMTLDSWLCEPVGMSLVELNGDGVYCAAFVGIKHMATLTKQSLQFSCPRCKAPIGTRCWNLFRFYPGGELRPLSQRIASNKKFNAKTSKKNSHCRTSHAERCCEFRGGLVMTPSSSHSTFQGATKSCTETNSENS